MLAVKKIASIVTFGSYRCSETQAMPGKQERSEGEFQDQFSWMNSAVHGVNQISRNK